MRLKPGLTALVLLATAAVHPLNAQVIRGQVVDSTTGSAVSSGFVILKSVAGAELQRTLTTTDGRFTILPPGPGLYRLRSERIGYEAWESPVIRLQPRAALDFVLRVTALPVMLSAITVEEDTPCQVRADEGENTSVLWEEVRKALVAASWSAAQGLFRHQLLGYRRELDLSRRRVSDEEVSLSSGYSNSPFSSLSPDSLAEHGYVVDRSGGQWRWYYAPDANVLLDESFQSTHCFSIVRESRGDTPYVGLAFTPIPNRNVTDVEGTLWLLEESSALSELHYRYTGLTDVPADDRIGGTVEFLAMPSGAWIVHRWQIRTPRLVPREIRGLYTRRTELTLRGFQDVGGEVILIEGQDGSTVYTSPNVVHVAGMVFDSTRGKPLRDAVVTLEGTPYTGVTTRSGTFQIVALLEGEYGITFTHPWADSLGFVSQAKLLGELSPGDSISVSLALPTVQGILRQRCPAMAESENRRVLVGTVRDAAGQPVGRGVGVTVTWQRITMTTSDSPISVRNMGERVVTDDEGRYIVCGLPLNLTITVEAESGDGGSVMTRLRFYPGIIEVAKFPTDNSPYDAYGWEERIWPLNLQVVSPPRKVVFSGQVRDATTDQPLDAVPVTLSGVIVAITDDDGRFSVIRSLVDNQANEVSIRHPGFEPFQSKVTLTPGEDEISLTILLRRSPRPNGVL